MMKKLGKWWESIDLDNTFGFAFFNYILVLDLFIFHQFYFCLFLWDIVLD